MLCIHLTSARPDTPLALQPSVAGGGSDFYLSRLGSGRVALTAEQAAGFCGGGAHEGCQCCCDGRLVGPGGFLPKDDQCNAAFCYERFADNQFQDCAALYMEITSDGVKVAPPPPDPPSDDAPSPPSSPWAWVRAPDGLVTNPNSQNNPKNTSAGPPSAPFPVVASQLTIEGTVEELDQGYLKSGLAKYLSTTVHTVGPAEAPYDAAHGARLAFQPCIGGGVH